MSNSSVISRKDMREPDRFQVVANQAASWLAARKKQALVAAAVAVVAIVAAGAFVAVQSSRAEAAGRATSGLLALAAAPVVAEPPAGTTEKTFRSEDEKQRAVVAAADEVLAKHGAGRIASLALLVKGDALFALKDWDKAAAEYERFLRDARKDDSLRFGALEGLGLVAEAKGDLEGAVRAYQRMGQEAPAFADRADVERARVLALAGKKDEARQILTSFATTHKESPLARQASQQLAQLGAK